MVFLDNLLELSSIFNPLPLPHPSPLDLLIWLTLCCIHWIVGPIWFRYFIILLYIDISVGPVDWFLFNQINVTLLPLIIVIPFCLSKQFDLGNILKEENTNFVKRSLRRSRGKWLKETSRSFAHQFWPMTWIRMVCFSAPMDGKRRKLKWIDLIFKNPVSMRVNQTRQGKEKWKKNKNWKQN